jgi:hypothetical protein
MFFEHWASEPLALPNGEIRILEGQLGEWRWTTFGEGKVEIDDFADQYVPRPTVGDDVMRGKDDRVFMLANSHYHDAQQRTAREIERPS